MPRKRMIDPDIWDSEQFNNLCRDARLLFIGMFSNADDEGRLRASKHYLQKTIFGYDDDIDTEKVEVLKWQIQSQKLIKIYRNGASDYLVIPTWIKHQKISHAYPSKLPKPPTNEKDFIQSQSHSNSIHVTLHEHSNNNHDTLQEHYSLDQYSIDKVSIEESTLSKDKELKAPQDTFKELTKELNLLKNDKDKIVFLVNCFKRYHNDAPPSEFENIYGRMGNIVKIANKRHVVVLKAIWDTSSESIEESHLDYIQKTIKARLKKQDKQVVAYKMKHSSLDDLREKEKERQG